MMKKKRSDSRTVNCLELKFENFIRHHRLVVPKQSVILAVSGGVDSMVMLHLFSRLHKRTKLNLSVVHINHQLRGKESMEDEEFVRQVSAGRNIPYYCERIDVMSYVHEHGLSKQAAARQLRYECFERLRRQMKADVVATAHHADDNAETVLLNILRGTGIHGLAGIPLKRKSGCIIRPLLFSARSEINAYAIKHDIMYREDSSNLSLAYQRNVLRHNILPVLQKRNPNILQILNSIAGTMYSVDEKLRPMVDKALRSLIHKGHQDSMVLDIKKLKVKPDFLWYEIFVELLNRMQIEPTEKKVNALHRLCTLPTGRMVELSGALSAYRDRDEIVFRRTSEEMPNIQHVVLGRSYDYNGYRVSLGKPESAPTRYAKTREVEYVDAGQLGRRLVLRPWHAGDWFIPLGMKKKKKLSDFFTDQKIPRHQKSSIPILESDGAIVWICGRRLDDRFKLTELTRRAIRLTYKPLT